MTTAFITHPDCLLHEMGNYHPESPQRLTAIEDALKEAKVYDYLKIYEAPNVTRAQLELVHAKEYIEFLERSLPKDDYLHIDMDTALNPYTLKAAYRAAGGVIKAVDLILKGEASNAFCNVRPPGHHAEKDKAMGFCFLNNIAIGVAYALTKPNIKKVAIIDFDVHHGNGTENIFLQDSRVLICSSFQHPSFPGEPFKGKSKRIINVPLPPNSTSYEFRSQVEENWFPKIKAFKPDILFISAGFDAHYLDPLAELRLKEDDYTWVTEKLMELASQFSESRIISTLEGGYNLSALGRSATAHIRTLMDI